MIIILEHFTDPVPLHTDLDYWVLAATLVHLHTKLDHSTIHLPTINLTMIVISCLCNGLGQRSRVPFALRLLACDIPARLGRWRESQEGFYSLLDFCRREAEAAAAAQVPGCFKFDGFRV